MEIILHSPPPAAQRRPKFLAHAPQPQRAKELPTDTRFPRPIASFPVDQASFRGRFHVVSMSVLCRFHVAFGRFQNPILRIASPLTPAKGGTYVRSSQIHPRPKPFSQSLPPKPRRS